jgi:acetyltransferase-like isoleucine patch superfamily enzyme
MEKARHGSSPKRLAANTRTDGCLTFVHPTAEVSRDAKIGEGTKVWHQAQIREKAEIGKNCILGKGVYIDTGVYVGDNVKIGNGASVYHGVTLEDGVFIGPHACLTNDKNPRAVNKDGSLKKPEDWVAGRTLVEKSASIGAGAIVLPGVTVGRYAMVGAGSVVTKDVPEHALVYGNPSRIRGFVCMCGMKLEKAEESGEYFVMQCSACGERIKIKAGLYKQLHEKREQR